MSHSTRPGGAALPRRGLSLLAALVSTMAFGPSLAHAADLNATTSNFSSVYSSAAGGDTIHLASGDYGTWNPSTSKSSTVTITPQSGASVTMYPTISQSNIKLDGLTISGGYLNGAKNTSIVNTTVTGMLRIDTPKAITNAGVLIDHDTFSGINVCSSCYEGRLTVRGYQNTAPVGVTITNNLFGPGGDADGVQIIGDAYGVQVGPGNEFRGLAQVSAAHTDPLQLYGSSHTVITGNWMHDNATGIMAPDGSSQETITNNVIQTTGYPWPIILGAGVGDTVAHNTLPSGGDIAIDKANDGSTSSGDTVYNNIADAVVNTSGGAPQGTTADYNLLSGRTIGAHDVKGSPTYSGGSSPSSFAGFGLASGSAGVSKANDGRNIGVDATVFGSGSTGG